jgi:hypothetical protein
MNKTTDFSTGPSRFLLTFIFLPLTTLFLLAASVVTGAAAADFSSSRANVPKPHSIRNSSGQAQAVEAEAAVTLPSAYGEPLLLLLGGLALLAIATIVKLKVCQRQPLGSQERELFTLETSPNTESNQSILSGGK